MNKRGLRKILIRYHFLLLFLGCILFVMLFILVHLIHEFIAVIMPALFYSDFSLNNQLFIESVQIIG